MGWLARVRTYLCAQHPPQPRHFVPSRVKRTQLLEHATLRAALLERARSIGVGSSK